jgi:flagellar basal-body rod modification protein FlgD
VSTVTSTPIPTSTSAIGSPAATATATAKASSTGLGKDDFLKILMAQMQNMDPMSSSNQDPSQMTQQMTQYSILEQITNLNAASTQQQMAASHSQAIGLIGHKISYMPSAGSTTPVEGTVKSVQVGADGYPTMTVDTTAGVSLGQILAVQ